MEYDAIGSMTLIEQDDVGHADAMHGATSDQYLKNLKKAYE